MRLCRLKDQHKATDQINNLRGNLNFVAIGDGALDAEGKTIVSCREIVLDEETTILVNDPNTTPMNSSPNRGARVRSYVETLALTTSYRAINHAWIFLVRTTILGVFLILIAGICSQSALDGFDPNVTGFNINQMVVQADGTILIAGNFSQIGGSTYGDIGRLNRDGSVDTTFVDPNADQEIKDFAVQSDGKIVVVGNFVSLGGMPRNKIGRLNADGTLDMDFNPGADGNVEAVLIQPDGKIVVGGAFALLGGGDFGHNQRSKIGRLNADAEGSLDMGFNPGSNGNVLCLALQPDGKIVVAGDFTLLGGGDAGHTTRNNMGRLQPDGTLDMSFIDPNVNAKVLTLAMQADGKAVIGGGFTSVGSQSRMSIARVNTDGTVDLDFNPGANSMVEGLAVQPDGKILVGGFFDFLGGGTGVIPRHRVGRLTPAGEVDPDFDPVADSDVFSFTVQPDGNILAGGTFSSLGGSGRSRIGRLYPSGKLDTNFDPGADNDVRAIAIQPDGKIIVGGFFTHLGGGGTGTFDRNNIGRVNPDGSLDLDFDPDASSNVQALAVQSDGKIVVGGNFTAIKGDDSQKFVARLTPDGELDPDFVNPAPDNNVIALALQPDGKLLLGGDFANLGGVSHNRIGRLLENGEVDPTFNSDANLDARVEVLTLQQDDNILAGGVFTSHIVRLTPEGTVDPAFAATVNGDVFALLLQPDANILLSGEFTTLDGADRLLIGRLTINGGLDDEFNPGAAPADGKTDVLALALQTDGKILAAGEFTFLGNGGTTPRNRIGRLAPNGALDDLDPDADDALRALTVQADGKILVGGSFNQIGDGGTTPRSKIARLTNTDVAFQDLAIDNTATTLTWSRSGASPEVDRVTFELSSDGITYNPLPDPVRVLGGWQLGGQHFSVSQNLFVRARGFYATGKPDGQGQFVETVRNFFLTLAPVIDSSLSVTAPVGQSFSYQISATNLPTTFNATGLPAGLTCDPGTGLIAGTPTVIGTFPVNISAANAGGTDTEVLSLEVTAAQNPPVITSPLSATATVGQFFTYQITATNSPVSFNADPLADGLQVDQSSGVINGTPATDGTFMITITATNSGGTGSAVLTLTINPAPPPPPPEITSGPFPDTTKGQPFSYQITASNPPILSFGATGLPSGLTVHSDTGIIDGSSTEAGNFSITISATNAGGTGSKTQALNIGASQTSPPPDIISPFSTTATVGQFFIYQIVATGSPTSYDATNLPAGLFIDTVRGFISGIPEKVGITEISLTATNPDGSGMAILALNVNALPLGLNLASGTSVTGRTGSPFTFQVHTTGGGPGTQLSVSALPPGLAVNAMTGEISGVPTLDGSFAVALTVSDSGMSATSTLQFTFTSDPAFPVITSYGSATLIKGQPFKYTIVASSTSTEPTTFATIGPLPAGLTIDSVKGIISGTSQDSIALSGGPLVAGGIISNTEIIACNSNGCAAKDLFFLPPTGAANISTRLRVGTGDNVLIGGFITQGNSPLKLVTRGIGPSLSVDGPLPNPYLELHASSSVLATNDDWKNNLAGGSQETAIYNTSLAPTNSLESAILSAVEQGSYTAIMRGANGQTGVGLVEIYNLGAASLDLSSQAQLANISTRGLVQSDESVMIGGFISQSADPIQVVIRGIGPSLASFGVNGALADPVLELHKPDGTIVTNDNWVTGDQDALNATGLAPTNHFESAILFTLPAGEGAYTAIVRGAGGTTGVALVEAYFGNPCLKDSCP
jgi:uncharacterized delta-60 repeat protein